jgi:hypothetical protein
VAGVGTPARRRQPVVATHYRFDSKTARYCIRLKYILYDVFGLDDDDLEEYGARDDAAVPSEVGIDIAAVGLTACVLGLIVCPLPFVALGARAEFSSSFYILRLPPFVLGAGFLLRRYLARATANPTERPVHPPVRRLLPLVLEGVSAVVVIEFLVFVSGINLLVGVERWGAVAGSFLVAAVLWLPAAIGRRTVLEGRLMTLPRIPARTILAFLLAAAGATLIADLSSPPRFPH